MEAANVPIALAAIGERLATCIKSPTAGSKNRAVTAFSTPWIFSPAIVSPVTSVYKSSDSPIMGTTDTTSAISF